MAIKKRQITNKFSSRPGKRGVYIRGLTEDEYRKLQRLLWSTDENNNRKFKTQADVIAHLLKFEK